MKNISSLNNIHIPGNFGDYEQKKDVLKIKEIKNIFICQISKYKSSSSNESRLQVDKLDLPTNLKCNFNSSTRILWMGPQNYLVTSTKLNLMKDILNDFQDKDFAVTDLSHSRTVIEISGNKSKEVIKKGCPINVNDLQKGDCANSIFHGVTITIDVLETNPETLRIYSLRSFGESFYHSFTDASLEFGYKNL
tara:strand:+ start:1304 stop:1882 length:579 start_codon:yes stop_codon:yes gene_type:complete